jgi:hypothetical protein
LGRIEPGTISPAEVERAFNTQAAERLATVGITIHALSVRRIDVK